MVFSNLNESEKDAFFTLLDEYFQSRPEIFQQGTSETGEALKSHASAASAAVGRAFAANKTTPSSISSLQSSKSIGSVDTSSKFGALKSMGSKKTPPQGPVRAPSAFAPKQNNYAPPPSRSGTVASPPPRAADPEPEGEWAEALYDYKSDDPGDLQIEENQRILVVEKTSDDWWTGEVDGRRGLFPATYVKLL